MVLYLNQTQSARFNICPSFTPEAACLRPLIETKARGYSSCKFWNLISKCQKDHHPCCGGKLITRELNLHHPEGVGLGGTFPVSSPDWLLWWLITGENVTFEDETSWVIIRVRTGHLGRRGAWYGKGKECLLVFHLCSIVRHHHNSLLTRWRLDRLLCGCQEDKVINVLSNIQTCQKKRLIPNIFSLKALPV